MPLYQHPCGQPPLDQAPGHHVRRRSGMANDHILSTLHRLRRCASCGMERRFPNRDRGMAVEGGLHRPDSGGVFLSPPLAVLACDGREGGIKEGSLLRGLD